MSWGAGSYFKKTMASGGTLTSAYDLGRMWQSVWLAVPSMTSNSQVQIQGSHDGTTFRRVMHPPINSSTVGVNVFAISSAATNSIVPIPNGFQYLKVETTATVDSGCEFVVICSDV